MGPRGRVLSLSQARAGSTLQGPLPTGAGGTEGPPQSGEGFPGPSSVPPPAPDLLWQRGGVPGHPGHLPTEQGRWAWAAVGAGPLPAALSRG